MSIFCLALFPVFDSGRQTLPMMQALFGMAIVICIPLILLFSAWELKIVVIELCTVRPVLSYLLVGIGPLAG